MVTAEALKCMALPQQPGASKIIGTISQHMPELWECYSVVLSEIKAAWRTQWESELKKTSTGATEVSQGEKTTTVTVSLVDEDECTISVKKKARVSTDSV
eukprot:6485300-Amphidinium_carterae.1